MRTRAERRHFERRAKRRHETNLPKQEGKGRRMKDDPEEEDQSWMDGGSIYDIDNTEDDYGD